MSQELPDRLRRAHQLFVEAYRLHMAGDVDAAISRYQESIASRPTAEAHTFLGWALSFLERLDDAIAECKKAIAVDPDFGNPYNDIGSYLLNRASSTRRFRGSTRRFTPHDTSRATTRTATSDASTGRRAC
jgi:tetratricopeptide (TPR) repeat protein